MSFLECLARVENMILLTLYFSQLNFYPRKTFLEKSHLLLECVLRRQEMKEGRANKKMG